MSTQRPTALTLDRRPEARAFKIEDLLHEVSVGRVRVPRFQRDIAWSRDDARKLIDSIIRGYPVGTLLFWETKAPAAELVFGGALRFAAHERSDAWWVIDGQQRLTSLVRVLLARDPSSDDFALAYDLEAHVLARDRPETSPPRWLPLHRVLDAESLLQWLFEYQPAPSLRKRAIAVGRRIREYEIPAYLVRTDDEGVLREIFGRINSTGKALRDHEVFEALHASRGGRSPASLGQIAVRLEKLGFGRPEEKVIHRLLRVLRDKAAGVRRDDELRLAPDDVPRAYADTFEAASRAITFLRTDAGIPHYGLLPYKQPFVALGRFFHLHPTPRARSRELLSRWLWRGAWSGSHRGDTVSTRTILEQIDTDEEHSVQRLLALVGRTAPVLPKVDTPFRSNTAGSRLQLLALHALGPRHLHTGAVIDARSIGGGPYPDIFTRRDHDGSRTIANRLFHPPLHGRRQAILAAPPEVLASHAIDEQAIKALHTNQSSDFFRHRGRIVLQSLHDLLERRARWRETDRPSIASLIVED